MRLIFFLMLALMIAITLVVFPDQANQMLRLQALGWVFETKQGTFIVVLFLLLMVAWLLRTLIRTLFSGSGQLWSSLRMGSEKRRQRRLQETVTSWLNGNGALNMRLLKSSKQVLPEWVLDLLAVLATPADKLGAPDQKRAPLLTILMARTISSPTVMPKVDIALRKAHLKAWLAISPDAALAKARMADIAEEEGDWQARISFLEHNWQKTGQPADDSKQSLKRAYQKLAETDANQALLLLRKAYRLDPADSAVVLAYGLAQLREGESQNTILLWMNYLEQHDSIVVAAELLTLLKQHNPLKVYRKLERKNGAEISLALRWLRSELAHFSKLDGLAYEQMQLLADEDKYAPAWESMANWHHSAGEYKQASVCFKQALRLAG
ncbi:MAG: heme biosynthesis HemY N-terminal domain-containing protein [Mariprofundus sp.]|nr:heme biosynthesis HemY N-terminal domain-containing protein [Mariprofundus sp.]